VQEVLAQYTPLIASVLSPTLGGPLQAEDTAMLHKTTFLSVLALGLFASAAAAASSDPTVQQIYQAAQSGNVARAEQMVNEVLQDHPRSGKAHYVAAEVYARAGDFSTARRELSEAQALEPGLPFAEPQSVRALKAELAQGRFIQRAQRLPYTPALGPAGLHGRSRPWGLILLLVAGIVIVWAFVRRRRQTLYTAYPVQPGMPGVGPMGMGGPPSYPYGYGPGAGSGIMSGIGTGLAMGAGMAAGEALVNRVIEGPQSGGFIPPADAGGLGDPQVNGDMGGNDFGVSDPGSWDDGGGDPGGGDFGAGGDGGWT
jgi:uncharacterized protein